MLNGVESPKERGKLLSDNSAADSRQEGRADALRKPVWASGRAPRAVGGARNRFLTGMGFATAQLGGGRTVCECAIAALFFWPDLCFLKGREHGERGEWRGSGLARCRSWVSLRIPWRLMRSRGGGRFCRAGAGAGVRCWVGDAERAMFHGEGALCGLARSRRTGGPQGLHS